MRPALVHGSASAGSSSSDVCCENGFLVNARRKVEDGSGIRAAIETGNAYEIAPKGSSSVPPMEGVAPLETGVAALPSAIELAKDFVRFFSAGARMVGVALFLLSTSFFLDLLWNRLVHRLEIGGESGLTSSSESEDSMGRGESLDCVGRREEEDLLPLLPSIPLIVSFVQHR